jgi:hypothetical protein
MSSKSHSTSKQWMVAAALALGASSALADDSSMNPFIGDSYKYFNGGNVGIPGQFSRPVMSIVAADPSWRQSHPNGLTEHDLQGLSSSGLSAAAGQLNPVVASAPADPAWRQSPQNPSERELQALSSSSLARWGLPNVETNVAQNPGKETFSARLARLFHPESGTPTGAN